MSNSMKTSHVLGELPKMVNSKNETRVGSKSLNRSGMATFCTNLRSVMQLSQDQMRSKAHLKIALQNASWYESEYRKAEYRHSLQRTALP